MNKALLIVLVFGLLLCAHTAEGWRRRGGGKAAPDPATGAGGKADAIREERMNEYMEEVPI
uniref:Uncharacterized LOC100184921 n=1 Tax=Ciona intestinalis TaxID=7719 RepID=F6UHJ4_CIOIN